MSKLKPYTGDIVCPPDPATLARDLKFELEAILAHWHVDYCKQWEYLVSFRGFDSSFGKWLPEHILENT